MESREVLHWRVAHTGSSICLLSRASLVRVQPRLPPNQLLRRIERCPERQCRPGSRLANLSGPWCRIRRSPPRFGRRILYTDLRALTVRGRPAFAYALLPLFDTSVAQCGKRRPGR